LETDTEAEGKTMEKEKEKKGPEGLVSAVNRLADLVAYQKGSVVSRTVIDKKVGTVTLFSFDEGQGLSEHTAPFDALVYLLDGEAEISISGKPLHLREGEMTVMPADQPHALKAMGRFKMLLVMIRSQ
jgi:quercetin dioxygenase-like cupin family protein